MSSTQFKRPCIRDTCVVNRPQLLRSRFAKCIEKRQRHALHLAVGNVVLMDYMFGHCHSYGLQKHCGKTVIDAPSRKTYTHCWPHYTLQLSMSCCYTVSGHCRRHLKDPPPAWHLRSPSPRTSPLRPSRYLKATCGCYEAQKNYMDESRLYSELRGAYITSIFLHGVLIS